MSEVYKEEKTSWMKHFDFIVLDILILQIAFNIGYLLRMETGWLYLNKEYTRLSIVLILIGICVGFFLEGYSGVLRRGYFIEFKETVKYVSLSSGFLIIYLFLVKNSDTYSRLTIFHLWWLGIILDYIARIGLKTYLKKKQASKARAVLIITTEEQAEENVKQLKEHAYAGIYPIGIAIVGAYSGTKTIAGVPVIGKETEVLSYITGHVVDEIYINTSREVKLESEVEKYIEAGVTVHINLLETKGIAGYKCMEDFAGETVLTMTFKSATARQLLMKRMLDICGGLVGVVMMGIIFLFVAPIKELMKHNQMEGLMFKMDNDPRIFPFGHFLRDSSLDEFPQFWNVLKGDMSLVGTRPPTVDEYEQYELHHRRRVSIKPGLTGLWQVSGRSDITDFEEVVRLDTEYISNWRLASDLKILIKTVGVVLARKGSK